MTWLILLASLLIMGWCVHKVLRYPKEPSTRGFRIFFVVLFWIWAFLWGIMLASQISTWVAGLS